jgi:cytochrome P450
MNLDFSPPKPAGSHWELAKELWGSCPYFFNTFAQGYWVFTQYDAVRDMFKNPDIFSSESFTAWEPEPVYRFVPTQIDPPDNIKYRRILNKWFSPARMEAAEPTIRAIARRLVQETAPLGRCDFVKQFGLRFPTEAFLGVIGVPVSEAGAFVAWVEDFFAGFGGDPSAQERMVAALMSIRSYWSDAVTERRGEPGPREGDLASYLMHASYDGERPLTDTELLDMLVVLVLAGLDTTRGELGYMFHHLANHPDDRRRLIEEPEIIPFAVEETLRYYTIVFGVGRKVSRNVEFHGVELKKGDMVYGLVSAANRDPAVYERAEEYVVDRKNNHHFGFASGPHRCLGMHLARREMQIGVEEWLRVIPDFRVATDATLLERGGGSMMSLKSLPLEWELGS